MIASFAGIWPKSLIYFNNASGVPKTFGNANKMHQLREGFFNKIPIEFLTRSRQTSRYLPSQVRCFTNKYRPKTENDEVQWENLFATTVPATGLISDIVQMCISTWGMLKQWRKWLLGEDRNTVLQIIGSFNQFSNFTTDNRMAIAISGGINVKYQLQFLNLKIPQNKSKWEFTLS